MRRNVVGHDRDCERRWSIVNLLEHYVTNITHEEPVEKNGMLFFKVVCDVDCYGRKEVQTEVLLSEDDYVEAKRKGCYLD